MIRWGVDVSEIQSLSSEVDKLTQSVHFWNTAMIVIMFLAAIAATGLVMAQYRAFKQAQLLAETEAKLSKAKDRDKDFKINELAVKAEELTKQNIISSVELEKERKKRLELEARVAWRKITEDQQMQLSSQLSQFHDMEARLEFMAGDLEGEYFASDIAAMLHKSKWFIPIKPGSLMLFANFGDKYIPNEKLKKTGLEIDSSTHKISHEAAEVLMRVLNSIGFDAVYIGVKRNFDTNERPIVYIRVYTKPDHVQGEHKINQQN